MLALGVYSLYVAVAMLCDEHHSLYLMAFIAATALVAWGHFRWGTALSASWLWWAGPG